MVSILQSLGAEVARKRKREATSDEHAEREAASRDQCYVCGAARPQYVTTANISSGTTEIEIAAASASVSVPSVPVCSKRCERRHLAKHGCRVLPSPQKRQQQQQEKSHHRSKKRLREQSNSDSRSRKRSSAGAGAALVTVTAASRFPPGHIVHELLKGARAQPSATVTVEEVGEFSIAADTTRVAAVPALQ